MAQQTTVDLLQRIEQCDNQPDKLRILQGIMDKTDHLESQLSDAISERNDYRATFDLQQTRMEAATKLWQKETRNADVLPDLGALLDWLCWR